MIPPSGAVTCAMHMVEGLMSNTGLDGYNSTLDSILSNWNKGCVELFQEIGQYAQLCHDLFEETYHITEDAPGVYDYEVSSMFGDWFADMILFEHDPTPEEAEAKLRELAAEFWKEINKERNRAATNIS